MPIYKRGDMWSVFDEVDHFILTTNAIIKNNGAVVMGAGLAKQARDRFPGLDIKIGQAIKSKMKMHTRYGLILGSKIGAFQVKHHWDESADLKLIEHSVNMLCSHALENPSHTYALNFPGVGNGGLRKYKVKPLLKTLPDNVQIWTFE